MDIKRMLTRGGQVFAAEIVDGQEQYKVFVESLENNVILPELIKSGWELVSLPFTLKRNGMTLDKLPRMEYSPDREEEMEMYDLLGTQLTVEEKRAYLSEDKVETINNTTGKYTIETREEFLEYIDTVVGKGKEEDFLPINYFVHPNALFSLEEYKDPKNGMYVQKLTDRRNLSMMQFNNLRDWALANGLKSDFKPIDFLSFYFQWGLCGLRVSVLSKKIEQHYALTGVTGFGMESMPYLHEFALIDRNQKIYTTPGTENYKPLNNVSAVMLSQGLHGKETAVIKTVSQTTEAVEEWNTIETSIKISVRDIFLGNTRLMSLAVMGKFGYIYPMCWNPSMTEEMNNDMFLRAIAQDFIDRRKLKVEVSSYLALLESGCSPLAALIYMRSRYTSSEEELGVEKQPQTSVDTIVKFLNGEEIDESEESILIDIKEGVMNIGATRAGKAEDAAALGDHLYTQLYCINKILNIPAKQIYDELSNYENSELWRDGTMYFTDGTITVPVDANRIVRTYQGYIADIKRYRREQAATASELIWVKEVARELGPESAKRHVAVKGYTVYVNPKVERILSAIEDDYKAYLKQYVANPMKMARYMDDSRLVAINTLFTGALTGMYTYPEEISRRLFRVSKEDRELYKSVVIGPKVDTTICIADNAVYNDEATSWHWYCANAVITPYEVRPRFGQLVKETSLCAVWENTEGSPIFAELKKRGFVKEGDPSWSLLALQKPIVPDRGFLDLTLSQYYENAVSEQREYDHTKAYKAPTHPVDMIYGNKEAADEEEDEPAREGEEYKFKVGKVATLEYEEMTPKEEVPLYKPIQQYMQMTAEDFYQTGGDLTMPKSEGREPIDVVDDYTMCCKGKTVRPGDVAGLSPEKYQVSHMYGRKYMIRDTNEKYWTVRA